jgi:hypothetical protein
MVMMKSIKKYLLLACAMSSLSTFVQGVVVEANPDTTILNNRDKLSCRNHDSLASFYSEDLFKEKIFCLKEFVIESLNESIETSIKTSKVRKQLNDLATALAHVNEILYIDSIGCSGGALAFVSSRYGSSLYDSHVMSFCPNILKNYQRAFLVKHNSDQMEDLVDILLINILVHEGLHLVGYEHSREMYKTIKKIVNEMGFPSIHKKKNGKMSNWFKGLFLIAEDGSITL